MAVAVANSVAPAIDELLGDDACAPLVRLADAGFASHQHYGAYFDLVLGSPEGVTLPENERMAIARELVRDVAAMAGDENSGALEFKRGDPPQVSTLTAEFCSEAELARLRRWWDIEPENSMGLTGVTHEQLEAARNQIAAVYDALRQAAPELHAEILEIVTEFVVYQQDGTQQMGFGGATSFALWGAVAMNVNSQRNWLHYYQTIVHEAAHNLLFAIAREEPLLLDDIESTYYSPVREDARPLDGIFHAAFVSVREALALDKLLVWNDSSGSLEQDEVNFAEFLLDQSVSAFWECAEILRGEGKLTPLGNAILTECEAFTKANFALVEQSA